MSDMLKTQDFVFIRAEDLQDMRAELKALRAENDALRAQWESVPWEELYAATVLGLVWAAQATDDAAGGMDACNRALEWLAANAPQEATE